MVVFPVTVRVEYVVLLFRHSLCKSRSCAGTQEDSFEKIKLKIPKVKNTVRVLEKESTHTINKIETIKNIQNPNMNIGGSDLIVAGRTCTRTLVYVYQYPDRNLIE